MKHCQNEHFLFVYIVRNAARFQHFFAEIRHPLAVTRQPPVYITERTLDDAQHKVSACYFHDRYLRSGSIKIYTLSEFVFTAL